jgi:hypothetical protein
MRINLDTPCIEIYADKFMDFYEYETDYISYGKPEPLREHLEFYLKRNADDASGDKLQEGEEEIIRGILAEGYAETCNTNYYKIEAVEVFSKNDYTWEYHLIIPVSEVDKHNEKVRLEEEQWEKYHPKTEVEEKTPAVQVEKPVYTNADDLPF